MQEWIWLQFSAMRGHVRVQTNTYKIRLFFFFILLLFLKWHQHGMTGTPSNEFRNAGKQVWSWKLTTYFFCPLVLKSTLSHARLLHYFFFFFLSNCHWNNPAFCEVLYKMQVVFLKLQSSNCAGVCTIAALAILYRISRTESLAVQKVKLQRNCLVLMTLFLFTVTV